MEKKSIDDEGYKPRVVLPLMEVREPAIRSGNGSVSVVLPLPAQTFLYGPFLRLPRGRHRLSFRCQVRQLIRDDGPILGLEIIAQNRILRAWRDYTATELADEQFLCFDVPSELAMGSGADSPFEFRFSHFGKALITMADMRLQDEPASADSAVETSDVGPWRMLGRLSRWPSAGAVRITPYSIIPLKLGRSLAPLRLPTGVFRARIACQLKRARSGSTPTLEFSVATRNGSPLNSRTFTATELRSGEVTFEFIVPRDISLDGGVSQKIDIRLRNFRNADVLLQALDLERISSEIPAMPAGTKGAAASGGKKRIVVLGNCQGSLLTEALRNDSRFARNFAVTYQHMELPANLHERSRQELDECDLMLVQDIREWENYPLRAHVPVGVPILRYPCIRLATPWPFDAYNGPDDRLARDRDYPNFEFTYFDGLLARLRKEIPDPEQRFRAYESLELERIVDFKRLHRFETARLEAMDKAFPAGIGAYILENYRSRQIFYTTAHPNGRLMSMMAEHLAKELGLSLTFWSFGQLNSFKRLQVPVHPRVASELGIVWASKNRKYLVRGKWVTWEQYFRRYIAYYG